MRWSSYAWDVAKATKEVANGVYLRLERAHQLLGRGNLLPYVSQLQCTNVQLISGG